MFILNFNFVLHSLCFSYFSFVTFENQFNFPLSKPPSTNHSQQLPYLPATIHCTMPYSANHHCYICGSMKHMAINGSLCPHHTLCVGKGTASTTEGIEKNITHWPFLRYLREDCNFCNWARKGIEQLPKKSMYFNIFQCLATDRFYFPIRG